MSKIMVVDDDLHIRTLVCALMQSQGFSTCEAVDGREAFRIIIDENPDLAVIDLMMPNMDGFELCQKLRKYYENMPILMLTAKSELPAKVKGFESGADDYLTKPFEGDELLMRVKALLRRYKIESSQIIEVGALVIDRNSYTVAVNEMREDIPRKEFELLFKLASFPDRTFSRAQLIEDIWGYDFEGNERTLDVHISRLRERFPEESCGCRITTIRGLGYRLEALQ